MNSKLKSYIVKGKEGREELERQREQLQEHNPTQEEKIVPLVKPPTQITEQIVEETPKNLVEEKVDRHKVVSVEVSDGVLTSVVLMLNQILEELSTLNDKVNLKLLNESALLQSRRKIVLNRDKNGKIIGADVLDVNDGE